jgi:beta-lactam-binding protein with PASTA domain
MRPRRRPPVPPDAAPTEVAPPAGVVEEEVPPVVEDEYIPPRRPPIPELWPWLLAFLLLVLGGLAAWYFLTRDNGHHKHRTTTTAVARGVQVPKVIGLQEAAAVQRLGKAGLVPKPIFRSSKTAAGTVFGQSPAEGARTARRSTVTVLVSSGTATVAVPFVTGLRASDAAQRLKTLGLTSTVNKTTSTRPPGVVIAQQPSAGTKVAKGGTVTLSVAVAPKKVAVPSVVGKGQSDAQAALRQAGLVAVAAQVASTQQKGLVVAQSPASGAQVAKGSKVRINVSRGPETTTSTPTTPVSGQVTVPNVVGENQTNAQKRLQRVGLKSSLSYVASSKPAGTVVTEQPTAGTTVTRGSRVALRISNGPAPKPLKTVPDVTGQDQGTATATLRQAGFTVVTIDQPTTDQTQNGIVLDEQPTPGSRIPAGSQVTIYVGVFG